MVDIPINVEVDCSNGPCGRSKHVIVNPIIHKVTHLVVEDRRFPGESTRLVPVEKVADMTPNRIRLACTWEEVVTLEPFVTTRYVKVPRPSYPGGLFAGDEYTFDAYTEPYVLYDDDLKPIPEVHVPTGEVDIHRGMKVEATDGKIGQVEALVVEPENWDITHLTLQEGHFWGKREIAVPISAVDRVAEDTIYLKLDKQEVESLPSVPLKR